MCSGFDHASNTMRAGASIVRVTTSSRSVVGSTALPCRIAGLLFLEVLRIGVEPVEALLPEFAVVAEPPCRLAQRRRAEPDRPVLRVPSARDESRLLEHLEVPGDGRLREIERRHELVDRGLPRREAGED